MSAIQQILARGFGVTQLIQTQNPQPSISLQNSIDAMKNEIMLLRQAQPRYFTFLKSSRAALSSNVANDSMILAGPPIPQGYRGKIIDFNLNFGTAAGTVKWVIVDTNGQILTNVVIGIAATQNGQGATILEEGQRFAVVGQTAGAGTFDTFCTGEIQKVTPY